MEVTIDKTGPRIIYLTVKTDSLDLEEYIEKIHNRLEKRTIIPGFEKGSAPRDAIENYVGRDKIIEDAIEEMISITCSNVIKEQKLETEMQPMVKIKQRDPLIFEMVVILKPVVELGDYHSIVVEQESLDVKDEEIDEVLEKLRPRFAKYEIVDRSVQEEDLVTIDIEGFVFEYTFIDKKKVQFKVNSKASLDLPGLYKKMIGMKNNEEKEFKLKLPENYTDKAIAGKEALFTIKIYDIQNIILPQINDEFANKIAPDVKTLSLLRERIEKNMRKEREQNAKSKYERKVVEALIEKSKFEYSPLMVDMEVQGLIEDYKEQLKVSYTDNKEYEEELTQLSDEKLKERAHELAIKRITWSLVIDEVAKIENIEVSDKELAEEIEKMISEAGDGKEERREHLNHGQNRQNVYDIVKARKTIKKLTEIVQSSNNHSS